MRLSDTHPEAEAVLIGLIRRSSPAQRLQRARALTSRAASASKRAIARSFPHRSPREIDLAFIELHYGLELAREVAQTTHGRNNAARLD